MLPDDPEGLLNKLKKAKPTAGDEAAPDSDSEDDAPPRRLRRRRPARRLPPAQRRACAQYNAGSGSAAPAPRRRTD